MVLEDAGPFYRLPGPPESYEGVRVKRARVGNTHPWNRYFNRPLRFLAPDIPALCAFLASCRYADDRTTRSRSDFWEPPDEFECRRSGDCEDHALWAWRQLVHIGYRARFVMGRRHAWVHVFADGAWWAFESTFKGSGRVPVESYQAFWSVERLKPKDFAYFAHFREGLPRSAA